MTKYGMGDEATIKEVLDDVDTDKVQLINILETKNMQLLFQFTTLHLSFLLLNWQDGLISYEEFVDMMRR